MDELPDPTQEPQIFTVTGNKSVGSQLAGAIQRDSDIRPAVPLTTVHNHFNLMFHSQDEGRSDATEPKTRVVDQLGNIKIKLGSAGSAKDEPDLQAAYVFNNANDIRAQELKLKALVSFKGKSNAVKWANPPSQRDMRSQFKKIKS